MSPIPDTTPIFAFPFPQDTDAPDGPSQTEALALAVETALVATQADLAAVETTVAPVGSILMWPTATAPTGWLICNGSTFSAGTYPALNTLLGGNTLPNLNQRVPMGAGDNAGVAGAGTAVLGTGGAPTATLTTTELPTHTHDVSHSHSIPDIVISATSTGPGGGENGGQSLVQGATTGRFAHPVDTAGSGNVGNTNPTSTPAGSGAAFSILNPFLALNFIIRAA